MKPALGLLRRKRERLLLLASTRVQEPEEQRWEQVQRSEQALAPHWEPAQQEQWERPQPVLSPFPRGTRRRSLSSFDRSL